MANEVKAFNTIAITDIKNVNGQTDENIKELNAQEFAGYSGAAGNFHGARFVHGGGWVAVASPYSSAYTTIMQYKAATSSGDTSDFGDLSTAAVTIASACNGTRLLFFGGET